MPDERLRSLSWGFELLRELVADLDMPGDLRDRAARLSNVYPSPAVLVQLISDDAKTMRCELADAIEDAGSLFRDVQASGRGNGATRKSVLYTLRHFPMPGVAKRWAGRGFGDGIDCWLAR
jgi:hypothetical protein